jgi:TusA-related sulfurtransferase
MKELQVGDHLRVEASDPSFQSDIEAWVRKMGHDLKSFEESQGVQKVVLEKRA